jgi:hypothetical protein
MVSIESVELGQACYDFEKLIEKYKDVLPCYERDGRIFHDYIYIYIYIYIILFLNFFYDCEKELEEAKYFENDFLII